MSVAAIGLARAEIELKSFFRQWDAVVFTFSLPAILLLVLGSICTEEVAGTGVTVSQVFTGGMIAGGVASTSFINLGIGIATDRDDGTLKRLRGMPVSPVSYFIGKIGLVLTASLASGRRPPPRHPRPSRRRMPDGDGATATARVLAVSPATQVVVLTTYKSDADILRAVEAGAAGYLLKDASRADLLAAVRAAARGETVLAPSVANRLLHHVRQPSAGTLSPRELEVLRLVARGLSNHEIAAALHIGEATVKTHLLRAFAKLGVSDRTAAVTTAMAARLLPPP